MRRTWVAIACVVAAAAVGCPFVAGQTTLPAASRPATSAPADPVAPADPATLVRQLSSPDWRTRRTAREALVHLGDDAVATLQALIQSAPDEEARHQAQEALAQIQQNRALGPSYITLHLKDAKPQEVFAEISRQCHAPLTPYPDNLWAQANFPPLTIDVDRKPFWDVVPGVCQHFGVDFRQYMTSLRIMRSGANQLLGVTEVDGPFLIVADRITSSRTKMLGGNRAETSTFNMNLSLYPEPKITMLRGLASMTLIEAVDDHGNSLLPAPSSRTMASGGFGGGVAQLFAPMQYPKKNPGSRIVRFRAEARFNIQTKSQEIQIPDVLKTRDYHASLRNMEFTLKELVAKDAGYEMRIRVIPSNNAPPEFRDIFNQVQANLRLLDAHGDELPHHGINSNPTNNSAVDINLIFGPSPTGRAPDKVVFVVPVESRPITVPIHFTDIPLFEN